MKNKNLYQIRGQSHYIYTVPVSASVVAGIVSRRAFLTSNTAG